MSILDLMHRLPMECGAALNIKDLAPAPATIPITLQPTTIQRTVPHDPWIDIMPWPAARDSLILNQGLYDEDELCTDMMGGLYEGFDEIESRGIIVWGEPWSVSGWEASEGFVRKWGSLLLKGCTELMESTQRYRESRGEERITIEAEGWR
ncbi:uncharacterized protein JN550_006501 [Neoarthrinium moseri]|nr:uncharacterized protein JN550_006501 [Neoarthrinium moseri]KAI1868013.1 hypothetical protein JN550_006501 [Neoarthrinium moseri]